MVFKEMPQELVEKLIEGYENEIEPAYKVQEAFYRQMACPRCQGRCEKIFLSKEHAFSEGSLVPRSGLKCTLCDCVFDPHSGVILDLGNPGKIPGRVGAANVPYIGGEEED